MLGSTNWGTSASAASKDPWSRIPGAPRAQGGGSINGVPKSWMVKGKSETNMDDVWW